MSGSGSVSTAARVHVIKSDPSEEGGSHSQAQNKRKEKGKGKGKVKFENGQSRQNHQSQGQGSRAGPSQNKNRRGRGGHVHAGQKRDVTIANETTDDISHVQANKRHKSEKRSGPVQPHPDFWHPDGSVVVEAENTKFKLHQSMLQKNSAYFAYFGGRAYLEVEADERSPNAHIPVYRISETTADDFAALLTVIEEPMCGRRKYTDDALPMPILAGVLRAARALSFDAQRKWAERVFERMWPASARRAHGRGHPTRVRRARARAAHTRSTAYASARVTNCCGCPRSGRASRIPASFSPTRTCCACCTRASSFALPGLRRPERRRPEFPCLRGMESDRGPCAVTSGDRVHSRWAELVHASGVFAQRMIDPLMGLQDLVDMPWKDEGFCRKCVAARANEWADLRTKLWDNLDVWLELATE
ncbi:hypothetical protein EDB84DRAFT_1676185 [Lactarius hengduanensis]|nr:hypothetical protein EDB84DRAFT_1676185 [Lactarius hengduanensis]